MFWFWFLLPIAGIFYLAIRSNKSDAKKRATAPRGATHVKTVKQLWVNQTVREYNDSGWSVVGQSSAKSFGSEVRVTITFQKN